MKEPFDPFWQARPLIDAINAAAPPRSTPAQRALDFFKPPTDAAPQLTRLERAFLAFHNANPHVYERFVKNCEALWANGWRHYSSRTLIAVMRFQWDLETGGELVFQRGDPNAFRVKLSNNHAPYYARKLIKDFPKFSKFFVLRHVEGEEE